MSRTCSASRHAVIIATQIERVEKIEDPEHAAESIRATVEALWKARAENNELLSALKSALSALEFFAPEESPRTLAKVRAAIAKAEGK